MNPHEQRSQHMSHLQRKFVREIRSSELSLQEIRAAYNIDNPQITRWLRNQFFFHDLRFALRETRRLRYLDLAVAGNVAVLKLAQAAQGQLVLEGRQVDVLIRIAELVEQLRILRGKLRRRGGGGGDRKDDGVADLCHPSSKEREAHLLRAMRQEERWSEAFNGEAALEGSDDGDDREDDAAS